MALPPPPNPADQNTRVWKDWFSKLQKSVSAGVTATWASLDKTGSKLADIITRPHSALQSVLGTGSFHLSSAEQAAVTAAVATGIVTGPASAVNNNVATFNGVTGKVIKDSGLILAGSNTGDQTISISGDVSAAGSTGVLSATVTKINGTSLAGLGTGIVKNTTGTGVPSIAVAADFPTLNQNTTGTAANVTTNANLTGDVTSVGNTTTIVKAPRMLANVSLGAGATSLASGVIPACNFLEIHIYISGYAGSDTASLQFNGAAGTAYRYRWLTSAAAATTFAAGLLAVSTDRIKIDAANTTNSRRVVAHVSNFSANTEKLVKFESTFGTTSAATQDTINLGQGAWVSGASAQITAISLVSSSNMNTGTQMVIFGWN